MAVAIEFQLAIPLRPQNLKLAVCEAAAGTAHTPPAHGSGLGLSSSKPAARSRLCWINRPAEWNLFLTFLFQAPQRRLIALGGEATVRSPA